MIIRHNGVLKEAHILARSGDRMRIVLEQRDDTVELSLVDGEWYAEDEAPVSFEFLWAAEIPLAFALNADSPEPSDTYRAATV